MKTNARRALLFIALLGAAYLTLLAPPPQTDAGVVEAVDVRSPSTRVASTKEGGQPTVLELKPRKPPAESKTLFASVTWNPPKPIVAAPAPPPTAPPLPFTYIGKRLEDGVWHVYVSRGDQTLIVREQQTIDGTYRIDAVKPPQMTLTYLPMDERQTLSIGAGE
jgi:hypothetical protein